MTKTERERASELGRALNALRKTHGGGRPKKLRRCPTCQLKLGVVEMRTHKCEGPAR